MSGEEITTVRKDRRDRVTDETKRGLTHRWADGQTWCGRRIPGVAAWNNYGKPEDVDCKTCLTAIKQDRPRPYKRH